jgi:hypothetical protein
MPAAYSKQSPYYSTDKFGKFLDVMIDRPITPKPADVLYTIDKVYENRPDLLAFDLYGSSALWWVFAQRNPNTIQDPIYDFKAGRSIYIPTKDQLTADLGL